MAFLTWVSQKLWLTFISCSWHEQYHWYSYQTSHFLHFHPLTCLSWSTPFGLRRSSILFIISISYFLPIFFCHSHFCLSCVIIEEECRSLQLQWHTWQMFSINISHTLPYLSQSLTQQALRWDLFILLVMYSHSSYLTALLRYNTNIVTYSTSTEHFLGFNIKSEGESKVCESYK